jgi:hypothetical protein
MPHVRLARTTTVAAVALLSTLLTGTAATAGPDTTPPGTPRAGYSHGFYCLTLIQGASRVTDDVTPQSQIRYEVYADGVYIGDLRDQGHVSGAFGILQLPHAGPNTVGVRAVDAAGNRSPLSNTNVVHGYYTPGCTPYRLP